MFESTESKTQTCPTCGEGNAVEAVMCWACYSPLKDARETRSRVWEKWRSKAEAVAGFALLGALISSGWWRGKARFATLGTSLSVVALLAAQQKRAEIKSKRRDAELGDDRSPICRIADTLLLYAIKDNASQVRIEQKSRGIDVFYLIDDEWREQMKIPLYVWCPLQNELQMRGESGAATLSPVGMRQNEWETLSAEERAVKFALRILIEAPRAEILLTRI